MSPFDVLQHYVSTYYQHSVCQQQHTHFSCLPQKYVTIYSDLCACQQYHFFWSVLEQCVITYWHHCVNSGTLTTAISPSGIVVLVCLCIMMVFWTE
jgi:hypothetical protein